MWPENHLREINRKCPVLQLLQSSSLIILYMHSQSASTIINDNIQVTNIQINDKYTMGIPVIDTIPSQSADESLSLPLSLIIDQSTLKYATTQN